MKRLLTAILSTVLTLSIIPCSVIRSEAAVSVLITDDSEWGFKNDENGRWVENNKTGENPKNIMLHSSDAASFFVL